MPAYLSEILITNLLAEPKPMVDEQRLLADLKPVGNQQRKASIRVRGDHGSVFDLHVRQSALDPYDYSVVLLVIRGGHGTILRRHNGTSHPHLNHLEGTRVDFVPHVHTATERYQDAGFNAEHYAEVTEDFADLAGALQSMLSAAAFRPPPQTSMPI